MISDSINVIHVFFSRFAEFLTSGTLICSTARNSQAADPLIAWGGCVRPRFKTVQYNQYWTLFQKLSNKAFRAGNMCHNYALIYVLQNNQQTIKKLQIKLITLQWPANVIYRQHLNWPFGLLFYMLAENRPHNQFTWNQGSFCACTQPMRDVWLGAH